ncbi:histidine kinase like sensor protein [Fischerella sp. NIES-4106]|jgi:CBS domain-containing protein|nr:histidine kinase like sensor protein [Fischerella sp. NIES-4106]
MQINDLLLSEPSIEAAIEQNPPIVAPETLLVDVIALMNQSRSNSKLSVDSPSIDFSKYPRHSSCVLVVQAKELIGILTERDIVRLTAGGINFQEVTIGEVMTKPVITLSQAEFSDIFGALFLFRRYRIRHLPILGTNREIIGVVSPKSIRSVLTPAHLLKVIRVADVMNTQVIRTPKIVSVLTLAQIMAEYRVSCVVISEEEPQPDLGCFIHKPLGIVTERDIVKFQAMQLNLAALQAETVMSTPLFLLNPEDSLWTAHQEMQRRRVRRLVISWDGGRGLGLVTQSSLLRIARSHPNAWNC